MLLHMTAQTQTKPGTGLIKGGLFVVGLWVVVLLIGVASGGDTLKITHLVIPFIGLVLAGVGFARRILHAVESR